MGTERILPCFWVAEMKRISVGAWHQLHEAHRGGPELSSADCCLLCAREALALVAAHSSEEVSTNCSMIGRR